MGARHLYEEQVIAGVGDPFVDLSKYAGLEKERCTLEAMDQGRPLIYGGRITAGDLLGDPDLLRKEGDGYIAGDIKSGGGEEAVGDEGESKPKKHYAVQLALYTDILERLGRSSGCRGFIWDIHGEEVTYDFIAMYGVRKPRRLWDDYQECLREARDIASRAAKTLPAYSSGTCKNCVWYTACIKRLEAANDLTLIPDLGRSKRDEMLGRIEFDSRTRGDQSGQLYRWGQRRYLQASVPRPSKKFHMRAKLLTAEDGKPYLRAPVALPVVDVELFFDIEVDPMRDICYLHGFVERRGGTNESRALRCVFCGRRHACCGGERFRRCSATCRRPTLRDLLLFKIRADNLSKAPQEVSACLQPRRKSKPCSIQRGRLICILTWC